MKSWHKLAALLAALLISGIGAVSYSTSQDVQSLKVGPNGELIANVRGGESDIIASSGQWVDISSQFSSTPAGWAISDGAIAKAEMDSNGQWSVTLMVDAAVSASASTLTVVLNGVSVSRRFALTSYHDVSGETSGAQINASEQIAQIVSASRTTFRVSGTFLVDSKPTWAP